MACRDIDRGSVILATKADFGNLASLWFVR
jgi:hypothetical protein